MTPTELANAGGISVPYASQILSGKRASISRGLAVHLYLQANYKHESLAGLTDEQIEFLGRLEPWTPTSERAA